MGAEEHGVVLLFSSQGKERRGGLGGEAQDVVGGPPSLAGNGASVSGGYREEMTPLRKPPGCNSLFTK